MARASSDKKALDIVTINMRKMSNVCDYFVIASGTSTTQVRAISDHIERKLKERDERPWHIEGEREGLWILLDYGDVVGHIFLDETRRFYNLERLWDDAPQKRFMEKESGAKPKKRAGPKAGAGPRKTRKTASRRKKSKGRKRS